MSCFIRGCTTKIKSKCKEGEARLSLFRPTSDEILELWRNAIPHGDTLQKHHRVCELHFKEDEVNKQFEHTVFDGTCYKLPKDKCSLKKGSVPSIFLNNDQSRRSELDFFVKRPPPLPTVNVECASTSLSQEASKQSSESDTSKNVGDVQCESSLQSCIGSKDLNLRNVDETHTVLDTVLPISSAVEQNNMANNNTESVVHTESKNAIFQEICSVLANNPQAIALPAAWICQIITTGLQCIMWTEWTQGYRAIAKRIVLFHDMNCHVYVEEIPVTLPLSSELKNIHDIADLITYVSNSVVPCAKVDDKTRASTCLGFVLKNPSASLPGPKSIRCTNCCQMRKRQQKQTISNEKIYKQKERQKRCTLRSIYLKKMNNRLKKKIDRLKKTMKNLKTECAKADVQALKKACENLPEPQQFAVQACFNASKIKDIRGIRYTNQWIYECLLLRIKSRKTYDHLRTHKILALPSLQALSRYMKVIKSSYGFDKNTFNILQKKTVHMNPSDVRGILLVDEMKLTKSLSFNRQQLQMEGFTNLGKYTPEHQKGQKGDHALVIMFQPFKGKWVQTLGCFLSKGSANGTVLHQLLMEAIILAERAGLKVDGIANDGASWNRSMWDLFGVTSNNVSVEHIVDPQRRLWFFSDFPHLIKCMRNFFSKHNKYDKIWTPDGNVILKHWYAILAIENPKAYNLKINYHLREEHIRPQFYQKMNVALAFQFFGAADAMELLKDTHPELADSDGSIRFCRTMKALITAMNSRTPLNALKPGNEMWKSIENFIEYLTKWEEEAKNNKYTFLTDSTSYGLKVSLQGALEICTFLVEKCGFQYLMTSRLNQDNLEQFFGMMRHCCGSNDHPDSALFIQMYKLVSTYSLVKPPKGSNVSGGELIDVLLKIKDIENDDERRSQWEAQIDTILDKGLHVETLSDAAKILEDHEYFKCSTSDYVLGYIAGFVARKARRFAKFKVDNKPILCNDCIASLQRNKNDKNLDDPNIYRLIRIKSKGFLIEPSIHLFSLISTLEKATLQALNTNNVNADTIFEITKVLEEQPPVVFVGCDTHKILFTHRIISFFLTTRMFFITKQANKNDSIEKEKTKENRKLSKLSYAPDNAVDIKIQMSDEIKTDKLNRKRIISANKSCRPKKIRKINKK